MHIIFPSSVDVIHSIFIDHDCEYTMYIYIYIILLYYIYIYIIFIYPYLNMSVWALRSFTLLAHPDGITGRRDLSGFRL